MATQLGMSFADVILLVFTFGALLFMAKDFRLGIMILMVTSALLFIWFYVLEIVYVLALIEFLASVVILSLTLLAVRGKAQYGGFI